MANIATTNISTTAANILLLLRLHYLHQEDRPALGLADPKNKVGKSRGAMGIGNEGGAAKGMGIDNGVLSVTMRAGAGAGVVAIVLLEKGDGENMLLLTHRIKMKK